MERKMIRERLQQTGKIKRGTNKDAVRQLMAHLILLLQKHLQQRYVWLAYASRAVDAGRYGADRRRQQRLKLRKQIQVCAKFLRAKDPTASFKKGWEDHLIFDGYGACEQHGREVGGTIEENLLLGLILSGKFDKPSHKKGVNMNVN